MTLWLNRSGRHCEHEAKFLKEGKIYLTWGGFERDLGKASSKEGIQKLLAEVYPESAPGRRRQNSTQLWAFAHRMKPGDWVCMPSKRKTIHIGEITGPYTFVLNAQNPYYHYRTVKWLETDIPRTNFDQDILNSLGAFTTICEIKRNNAEARVRAMQGNSWKSVGIRAGSVTLEGDETEDDGDASLDLEQIARDQIARMIVSKFSGHGMEDLVEAILQAQGFTTYHSEKGPDGGKDLLAAPDTLGFGRPRICVQVKSQDTPLERAVLDQLVGTMSDVQADQGLLVCWGGFKSSIKKESGRQFFKVRLWDQNDLIDQFLANYERLDEDLKAELPLKHIWAVASTEDANE